MEKDGWLIALVGVIALVAPVLLLIVVVVVGASLDLEPAMRRTGPMTEVSIDPVRAGLGVGAAVVLLGVAFWVIKRTDWSVED
jgi:hypothetical protein